MVKNILFVILVLLAGAPLFAQKYALPDITGLWQGTMYNDTTGLYYKYEIGISFEKNKYSGFSHTYFLKDDKSYYGVKKLDIHIDESNRIILKDDGLIANNYPEAPAKGVRQTNILSLVLNDSIMVLDGPYSTNSTRTFNAITGHIRVVRKNDFWKSALIPHLEELGRENQLSFVKRDIPKIDGSNVEEGQIIRLKKFPEQKAHAGAISSLPVAEQATSNTEKQIAQKSPADQNVHLASPKSSQEAEKKTTSGTPQKIWQKEIVQENGAISTPQPMPPSEEIALIENKHEKTLNPGLRKIAGTTSYKEQKNEISAISRVTLLTPPAAHAYERITLLQQTVEFSSDSLRISLYDNGEVDGDTVSVLMDGEVILAKAGLSTNAVKKTIYIDPERDEIVLVMYAENLGKIPPNTGLLVVQDGRSIYEVRFSGDYQKNAAIRFRRKR